MSEITPEQYAINTIVEKSRYEFEGEPEDLEAEVTGMEQVFYELCGDEATVIDDFKGAKTQCENAARYIESYLADLQVERASKILNEETTWGYTIQCLDPGRARLQPQKTGNPQVMEVPPVMMFVFDHGENSAYDIKIEI